VGFRVGLDIANISFVLVGNQTLDLLNFYQITKFTWAG
jgi:hypothetical protein